MKIWHISDTHGHHSQLKIPNEIDIVIHSGDASNSKDPYKNKKEMQNFLFWFSTLDIPNKLFVPGNHDTSIEHGLITQEYIEDLGIGYSSMNTVVFKNLNNLKIWGSPYVPRYGNWAFMKPRAEMMRKVWSKLNPEADIIVTHTPPKGILDYANRKIYDPSKNCEINIVEDCGCLSLRKTINQVEPLLHCFGHIHSTRNITNNGTRTIPGLRTIFSNAACCMDKEKDRMVYKGNIIHLKEK